MVIHRARTRTLHNGPSPPRLRARGDEAGSIALAMLLSLVGLALTAMLVPMVLAQVDSSRSYISRNKALNAAQAGLDVALAHVRAAKNGAGVGVLALLPCTTPAPPGPPDPLEGSVAVGDARYQVMIYYLTSDPRGQSDAWVQTNAMTCIPGGGVTSTPAYASLLSKGDDRPTGTFAARRTLRGTYTFQTNNQNIAGGLIHAFNGNPDLCFDAGSSSPASGANLQMQPCSLVSLQQRFAYNSDLTIVLVSSKTAANPLGMCLDAGSPQANGNPVQFRPCLSTPAPAAPHQRWSLTDESYFRGSDPVTLLLNSFCFRIQSPNTAGSFVNLGGCGSNFAPEAATGAGAAGAASGQLVNFSQFGRCLDVTEFWNWTTYGYLINWPCKQAPNVAQVGQNQRWTLPAVGATGTIRTLVRDPNVQPWCLESPLSTAPGQYVGIQRCPGLGIGLGIPPEMQWTVYGDTGVYTTSYRVVDYDGHCLAPTDQDATPGDFYPNGVKVSKMIVAVCDGSTLQKWNAPPGLQDSLPLKDIGEK